jgi:hypothetical protein
MHPAYLDFGFIGSFDGGLLFKRNNIQIWPFWLANANLPPAIRYSQNELILHGLWVGHHHPPMNAFITYVAGDDFGMKADAHRVQVSSNPPLVKPARVRLLTVTADLPARVRSIHLQVSCHTKLFDVVFFFFFFFFFFSP